MLPPILFKGMTLSGVLEHLVLKKGRFYLEEGSTFLPHWSRSLDRAIEYSTRRTIGGNTGEDYPAVVLALKHHKRHKVRILRGGRTMPKHTWCYTIDNNIPLGDVVVYADQGAIQPISALSRARIKPLVEIREHDHYEIGKEAMQEMIDSYKRMWEGLFRMEHPVQNRGKIHIAEREDLDNLISLEEEEDCEIVIGEKRNDSTKKGHDNLEERYYNRIIEEIYTPENPLKPV